MIPNLNYFDSNFEKSVPGPNRSTCKVHGVLEYIKYNLIIKGVDLIRKGVAPSGKRVRKLSGMSGFKLDILDMHARDTVRSCRVMSGNMSGHVQ